MQQGQASELALGAQGIESAKGAQGIESVCSKGTQPELALEVFKAIAKQEVVSDAVTYNAVINACSKISPSCPIELH